MNKDMLNELSALDAETVEKIAENAPELDKSTQERILKRCLAKDMSETVENVSGTERIRRPMFRNFAAAAAAIVLIGGIGGAFALGKHMRKNAPVESKAGLMTEKDTAPTTGTAVNEQTAVITAEQRTSAPVETTTIDKPTESDPMWLDPDYAGIDKAQSIVEYKAPENTDDEEYEEWLNGIPEEYRDVVRNLKPGEVIHLPCIPVKELPTDSAETTTCPPQTTTLPPDTTAPPHTTTEPDTEPTTGKTPDMYNPLWQETNQSVIQPIDGYWISDWCGSSYWWFDSQRRIGTYYNDNTCSGFSFSYNYFTSDSHIELMVLDRGNGYSGELYGTGNVVWISDDNFYISWKEETPIRQGGDSFERFVRNKAESMPEVGDTQKPQPE